jgi:mono/diheme cytochrome c family protein
MKTWVPKYWPVMVLTVVLAVVPLSANGNGHGHHGIEKQHPAGTHEDHGNRHHSKADASGHEHGHHGDHGLHQHDKWEAPPPAYATKYSDRWTDAAAVARGKQLFQTNCVVCHGDDGRGTGPAAKTLAHPPADLNHHFHMKPGDGDAYLVWRVSEGGMVEPFKSMKSAMPPFKTVLSADQRWDVLAYVHAQFHKGFKSETMPKSVTGEREIIALVPTNEQIVIEHGAIKDFMDAMTMGYKVNPAALLDGLRAGDQIRFTIDTEQKVIGKIEELH